jgi:hypothetical protein
MSNIENPKELVANILKIDIPETLATRRRPPQRQVIAKFDKIKITQFKVIACENGNIDNSQQQH